MTHISAKLKTQAEVIEKETTSGANTAERVGSAIKDVASEVINIDSYDVSANNSDAKYSLSTAIAAVPEDHQRGGLIIRFIDSTTSKYVTYTLLSSAWSTDETLWSSGTSIDGEVVTKVNTLWGIHYPVTFTIADNSSTAELDKMKMVVYDSGASTYPATSIAGSKVYSTYQSSSNSTTTIATTDLGTDGNYKTYDGDVKSGKTTYTFTDSKSGKSASKTYYHALACYMWFATTNTNTEVGSSTIYSSSPTSVLSISTIELTTNLDNDSYIYAAVPQGWTVTTVTAKGKVANVPYTMSALGTVTINSVTYQIYVSANTIKTTNGNTIAITGGTGEL